MDPFIPSLLLLGAFLSAEICYSNGHGAKRVDQMLGAGSWNIIYKD
jgi:hypothetical protein